MTNMGLKTIIINGTGNDVPAEALKEGNSVSFFLNGKKIVSKLPLSHLEPIVTIGDGMKTISLGEVEDFPYAISADEAEKIINAFK